MCTGCSNSLRLMYWCPLLNKSFIVHKQCSKAWIWFQCFVLILLNVLQELFWTNYPCVISAIGVCYHLRKHRHASLSVSLYHSLMWTLSHGAVYTSEVDFWMYHWCMVLHVYRIFWCTTGYHFHRVYSKLHTDTVCHKIFTNNNFANFANRMFLQKLWLWTFLFI